MTEEIIKIGELTVEIAKKDYNKLFLTFKEMLLCSDIEAATAVSIATGVCHECFEYPSGCQCWNDE